MGISDETEVGMIAIDETPISEIKATIPLLFRVFALLVKPVVFFISSFLTSSSLLHSISPVTLQRKRVLDMRRFLWKTDDLMENARRKRRGIGTHERLIIGLPVGATPTQEVPSVYVEKLQNGGRNSQKALTVPFPLECGRFLQGGDWPFQIVWRTDLEVEVERTHWVIAWAYWPYIFQDDYLNTVFDEVLSLRGSCRNNALPRSHGKSFEELHLSLSVPKRLSLQDRNNAICRSPRQIETYSLGKLEGL